MIASTLIQVCGTDHRVVEAGLLRSGTVDRKQMSDDPITRLNAALEGRYRVERELGEGGMAM